MPKRDEPEPPADFALDRETLAYVALKAKAFDALVGADDVTDASGAADDRFVDALEDESDNPAQSELAAAIDALNADAKASLVALVWMGRGDYEASEWTDALASAHERARGSTSRYLIGIPLLGDYIEEGADKLGISLAADEVAGLGDPDIDTRGGD
jgi:hypothetical protein